MDSSETYTAKVNEICAVYHEAEAIHEAGGHTVSVDKMTGIKALERKYPDKPVMSGKIARTVGGFLKHASGHKPNKQLQPVFVQLLFAKIY